MKTLIWVLVGMVVIATTSADARTFDFKALGSSGTSSGGTTWWGSTEKSKSAWFRIKIGGALKSDDKSTMEIRAATVFKNIRDKRTGLNDITKFSFDPINVGKPIFFMVSTGKAFSRLDNYYNDGSYDRGWQLAGCIIEIWQKGKVVKHWSNVPGKGGKAKLENSAKLLRIDSKGREVVSEYAGFDNATEVHSVDKDGERVDINEVLKPFREEGGTASTEEAKTYYLIRNVRIIEYNRTLIINQLERGIESSYVIKRKMSKDELSDYKIENSDCRVFENVDDLLSYLKTGTEKKSNEKWFFVVRDVTRVTMSDKRRALEDIVHDNGYYGNSTFNVMKRKFTDEEVKDFMSLNPNCKMFRDVDEFKTFIRNAKVVTEQELISARRQGINGGAAGVTPPVAVTNGMQRSTRNGSPSNKQP